MKPIQKKLIKREEFKKKKNTIDDLKVATWRRFINDEMSEDDVKLLLRACDYLENCKTDPKIITLKELPQKFSSAVKEGLPFVNVILMLIDAWLKNRMNTD